jgi:hypothetical protein
MWVTSMTKLEWLTASNTESMLEYLRGTASSRKLRLFACACCRRIWDLLDDSCQTAVEAAERYADGLGSTTELTALRRAAYVAAERLLPLPSIQHGYNQLEFFVLPKRWLPRFDAKAWKRDNDTSLDILLGDDADTIRTSLAGAWRFWSVINTVSEVWGKATTAGLGWCVIRTPEHAARARVGAPPDDVTDWYAALDGEREEQAGLLRHLIGNPFGPYPPPPFWSSTIVHLAEAVYAGDPFHEPLADGLEECGHSELAEHFRAEAIHPKGCWAVHVILGRA